MAINGKEEIIEVISKMSVLELAELVKALEEKFGVSAVPVFAGGMGASAQASSQPTSTEEKTEFSVVLTASGEKKVPVIKVIREITGLGLKEAKDLVDGAPKVVKENIPKAQAEEIKKKLLEVGATVEVK